MTTAKTGNTASKTPLAMQLRLVITDHKRLCYEIEVVFSDGSSICKRYDANHHTVIHFDDLAKACTSIAPPA